MRVIDSHTAGEPTRVILNGGPDLGKGSLAERAVRLRAEYPEFYTSTIAEPRGHDAMVGALIVPPTDPSCVTGVIYFNTVGNLGMCGHATIGLTVTLAHLGQIAPGQHRIETPVGIVSVDLLDRNTVQVTNVESHRHRAGVTLNVDGLGEITGDVAWGGNWFFIAPLDQLEIKPVNISKLTSVALEVRSALKARQITGQGEAEIDHIEFTGPPDPGGSDGRNFVLCPGGAYDRSPCGTGLSAKIACLAEDGVLSPGELWTQESVIGSTYKARYEEGANGGVIVTIEGQAFVTSDAQLYFDNADQFRDGILTRRLE
ncbi:proline racemase family protein [Aliiroseovarius sp. 2305UL8-7]|uniref:4-hydroxyproline epimerase n=1 Tax=Aliiroseovarius conchicola TaxID=3121637 RepID=UPI0035291AE7